VWALVHVSIIGINMVSIFYRAQESTGPTVRLLSNSNLPEPRHRCSFQDTCNHEDPFFSIWTNQTAREEYASLAQQGVHPIYYTYQGPMGSREMLKSCKSSGYTCILLAVRNLRPVAGVDGIYTFIQPLPTPEYRVAMKVENCSTIPDTYMQHVRGGATPTPLGPPRPILSMGDSEMVNSIPLSFGGVAYSGNLSQYKEDLKQECEANSKKIYISGDPWGGTVDLDTGRVAWTILILATTNETLLPKLAVEYAHSTTLGGLVFSSKNHATRAMDPTGKGILVDLSTCEGRLEYGNDIITRDLPGLIIQGGNALNCFLHRESGVINMKLFLDVNGSLYILLFAMCYAFSYYTLVQNHPQNTAFTATIFLRIPLAILAISLGEPMYPCALANISLGLSYFLDTRQRDSSRIMLHHLFEVMAVVMSFVNLFVGAPMFKEPPNSYLTPLVFMALWMHSLLLPSVLLLLHLSSPVASHTKKLLMHLKSPKPAEFQH